jgi:hypothetical protein
VLSLNPHLFVHVSVSPKLFGKMHMIGEDGKTKRKETIKKEIKRYGVGCIQRGRLPKHRQILPTYGLSLSVRGHQKNEVELVVPLNVVLSSLSSPRCSPEDIRSI